MADFSAVLRKTIGALSDPTPEARARVYEKARATVERQLTSMSPPPPQHIVDRQRARIEDAIAEVEAEFEPLAVSDPAGEFPDIDFDTVAPVPPMRPAARPAPPPTIPEAWEGETEARPQRQAAAAAPAAHSASAQRPAQPQRVRGSAPADLDGPALAAEPRAPRPKGERTGRPVAPEGDRRRSPLVAIAAALIGMVLVGGIGFAGWTYRDDLMALVQGPPPVEQPDVTPAEADAPEEPVDVATDTPADAAADPVDTDVAAVEPEGPPKFTQRLTEDGAEVDTGPATGEPDQGEGTSVAEVTPPAADTPPEQPAAPDAAEPAGSPLPATSETALPVGQRAIFYEERTGQEAGTAQAGTVLWSVTQASPGGDLPPEPAIKAESTIMAEDGSTELLKMELVLRRNGDRTLPASHIVEVTFSVPEGFAGRAIDAVQRITLKGTEQEPGNPLLAVPAKIEDNFFLVALTDFDTAIQTNLGLLGREKWIDIPMTYSTGRRALITLEKGVPGTRVFDEVLKAWQDRPLGG